MIVSPRPVTRLSVLLCVLLTAVFVAVSCSSTATPATNEAAIATSAPTTAPAPTATAGTVAVSSAGTTSYLDAVGEDLVPLPSQPDDVSWPTEAWIEAPLPTGANADAIASVIADAFDNESSPYGTIHAAVVINDGALVFERYGNGYDGIEPHVSWSVGKSVAHALLGVLVADGKVDMMSPAAVAEWRDDGDPRSAITPDMLARMSSGLEWDEGADAVTLFTMTGFEPAANLQVDRDLAAAPDTTFNYSTGSTAINGRIMGNIIGVGSEFEAWMHEVLYEPLGITSVEMEYDVDDYWIAGYGANMTARDFARFGLLYLRDGVWDGQRILPEGWVDYARTPSVTNPEYGSGFWLGFYGENSVSAEGFRGQKVILVPEEDLIVVVLASNADDEPTTMFANNLIDALT